MYATEQIHSHGTFCDERDESGNPCDICMDDCEACENVRFQRKMAAIGLFEATRRNYARNAQVRTFTAIGHGIPGMTLEVTIPAQRSASA